MIEDTIRDLIEGAPGTDEKIYGVLVGTVTDVKDLMALGRVKVHLDSLDADSGWARVVTPMAGVLSGQYFIPSLGDEVLVAFENGDTNAPYVIGSVWNSVQRPPFPSPLLGERVIRTPEGNQLSFRMAPPAVSLTTPDMTPAATGFPAGITLASNVMITLMCGATQVVLTPAGITITAPSVTITSSGPIVQTGTTSSTVVSDTASVVAFKQVAIAGLSVTIN